MGYDEQKLQLFVGVYYSISIILSLLTNIALLITMKTTKSALLRDMKYYLLNTTIFEIIVSTSTYFAQCRPVANKSTLAVFCYGPCKSFGQNTCFVTFAVVQCSVVAASFSILLSFYYRYSLLNLHSNNNHSHVKIFSIFSIFPTVMLIFQLLTDSDFAIVEAETREMHPDYDYVNNSLIGFSNSKGVGAIIAQSLISLGVYVAPLIAFYYRRVVPSSETLALLCNGPCKYLGVLPCQITFHILETSLISCATSLIIAFYYRYEMLTTNSFTRTGHFKQLVISYCVPLVFLVFEVLSPSDTSKVVAELTSLHPEYDTENYAVFGFSEAKSVIASVQTCMIMLGVYGTPIIAFVFRWKIMKILNTTKSFHPDKISQTKSMIQGLTLQTLLPLLCYCPSLTYYIIAQYTNTDSIIAEFAVSPFGFIYTIFDPLLTIYYVLPYRRTFKSMFSRQTTTITNVTVHHSETTRRAVI
ncbi:unnamed protein product [Caenorhabditis brenneri]